MSAAQPAVLQELAAVLDLGPGASQAPCRSGRVCTPAVTSSMSATVTPLTVNRGDQLATVEATRSSIDSLSQSGSGDLQTLCRYSAIECSILHRSSRVKGRPKSRFTPRSC